MKKMISLTFALMMTASLAACSGNTGTAGTTSAAAVESTTAESTAAESTVDTKSATVLESGAEESKESASAEEKPETITIKALNASKDEVDVEVPYDPQRIAILDMACLDILDNLGLGDRVVGSASTSLEYLQKYVTDSNIEKLGTIKEADMEAVMACEPDIIFIGGRLSTYYDALSEIAPVVFLATDSELGVVESVRKISATIASIFGLEEEIGEKMNGFDERIAALSAFAEGKNAIVGMCTSGSFNLLGDDGRCSLIGVEIGFNNLGNDVVAAQADSSRGNGGSGENGGGKGNGGSGEGSGRSGSQAAGTSTHGNEASFELVVDLNPDYIFVMDRDAAIGTDGAQLAQQIMENELVMGTDAYKNGHIVYLEHPAVWYTAEGGVTALDVMLQDLEGALLAE
ncbi:MAG: ABC transporter substrate-binding protein [bacterium]|nr:ABC transporter substrate-binding protein [bacterium]